MKKVAVAVIAVIAPADTVGDKAIYSSRFANLTLFTPPTASRQSRSKPVVNAQEVYAILFLF